MPLADALSERLGLPSNGSALSAARRDKNAMSEALRAAGLRTAEALKTADAERGGRLGGGARRLRRSWSNRSTAPAPTGSASATTPAAIEAAFAANLGRPNALHGANEQLLVQELLQGTQLFVNSISWDGVHHVSEVWRDNKLRAGANFIYDYEELLPRHGEQQDQVVPYVEAVLDALGIRFGPAHTEVMLTDDRAGAGRVGGAHARLGPRRDRRPLHAQPPDAHRRGLPRPALGRAPRRSSPTSWRPAPTA